MTDLRTDDWDEASHPRAENGQFGGGGGGASKGQGPASHATWRAGKERSAEFSHKATQALADRPRHFAGARSMLEASMQSKGLTPLTYDEPKTHDVHISDKLGAGTSGTHHMINGMVTLSKTTADRAQVFAERYAKDPEWERDRHERLVKDLNDPDILVREGAMKTIEEAHGMHVLVHETAHGYGPIHADDVKGLGVPVEEVTTEMTARAQMKEDYGYDVNALRASYGDKVPGAYQAFIDVGVYAIQNTYNLDRSAAKHILEHASIVFKQQPRPEKSHSAEENSREAYWARGRAGDTNSKAPLPDPVTTSPELLFARVVDAVMAQGPEGKGVVEPKDTEKADKLHEALSRGWHSVM